MSWLSLSDLFEYLCSGSTVIINIFTLTVWGIDFRCQNLTSKVDPRAERVKPCAARAGYMRFEADFKPNNMSLKWWVISFVVDAQLAWLVK